MLSKSTVEIFGDRQIVLNLKRRKNYEKLIFFLSIVCLLVFVACEQGEKADKATVSEPEKATEMAEEEAKK
ncbi:MAG: hypothetical protein JRE65_06925 [Deltaproteobacteria bacterium]|jgi:hypothetical protein|nr:hypothetical protein [Deltaproteobacteria bacterium]